MRDLAFLKFAKIGLRSVSHPPNFTSSTAGDAEKLLLRSKIQSRQKPILCFNTMGYYVVADINNIGTSAAMKEANSSFSAPAGQVLVGRMHTGDENGLTTYKFAPLIADPNSGVQLKYKLQNTVWTDGIKQSDLDYNAPDGWVIVGRKHDGDENGKTSFQISQVVISDTTLVSTTDGMKSTLIKESAGIWWVAANLGNLMQVMTGTSHSGDENGNTTYTGSLLFVKG
jgi:hypothetical protein